MCVQRACSITHIQTCTPFQIWQVNPKGRSRPCAVRRVLYFKEAISSRTAFEEKKNQKGVGGGGEVPLGAFTRRFRSQSKTQEASSTEDAKASSARTPESRLQAAKKSTQSVADFENMLLCRFGGGSWTRCVNMAKTKDISKVCIIIAH